MTDYWNPEWNDTMAEYSQALPPAEPQSKTYRVHTSTGAGPYLFIGDIEAAFTGAAIGARIMVACAGGTIVNLDHVVAFEPTGH